jgi:Fe-S cluster assembly iron-binding protein IscA
VTPSWTDQRAADQAADGLGKQQISQFGRQAVARKMSWLQVAVKWLGCSGAAYRVRLVSGTSRSANDLVAADGSFGAENWP